MKKKLMLLVAFFPIITFVLLFAGVVFANILQTSSNHDFTKVTPKDDEVLMLDVDNVRRWHNPKESDYKVFCTDCIRKGKKSIVFVRYVTKTSMDCGMGYFEEDGIFHMPSACNTAVIHLECVNGHKFTREFKTN